RRQRQMCIRDSSQPTTSPESTSETSCEVSGCNSEICSEKGKKMISPCVVLPQHVCLKKTKCEVQDTGKCGWTPNKEYRECIKRFMIK
ncbi:MAG: hypothetical protein EB078_09640, partial [Proteobacteria bacterium]|nr:hypothetical protein [Pseudomonadota bacterium]NDD05159.1 hypothetical protein [Pseudomonadota bacterium]